ncbi:hypothetical protein [Nonomuraea typhae]|uniref:hypothetical protein n=1 Tax=Nonomuraea typhae TaxID=2603600 RepID=UPI0012F89FC1|nr:hypothetical protein [Nonomuraea typhae]
MRRVLLGVLVTMFCTTAASAGEPRVTVYPSSAQPGDRVDVYVHECQTTAGGSVVASSMAFAGRHVRLARNGGPGGWAGSVAVHDEAISSAHEVTVQCTDRLARAYLTVRPGHPGQGPGTGGSLALLDAAGAEAAGAGAAGAEAAEIDVAGIGVAEIGGGQPGMAARAVWLAGALSVLLAAAGACALAVWRRRRGSRDAAP